jgi:hypothetical protein
MSSIQFTNMGEVIAGMNARVAKLNSIPKVAAQMGVLALNEIKPLCAVKTGTWQGSWQAKVKDMGRYRFELVVFSSGAFNGKGFNYGLLQERLNHPGEMGWNRAQQAMKDQWNSAMHGIASRTISNAVDEFASMAGF